MKTRSLLRRSTAALAAALLLAACPPRALAATQQELQQQMETAKEEYEQAAEHQEQAEEQVESEKQHIASLEGQAADIQAQLSAIYDELQQAKAERDAAEGEAEAAARALEEKQAEFDAQFASAQSQLRAIQKLQHGGSVTLLSQAGNWFQALTCGRVLDALMGYSSRLLADLDAQARELDAQRLEAEAAAERARAAQERLEASEASLNETSAKLAAALQASNADLNDYQAEAEAAAQLTEVAKRAYQEATAALDNFARQQNEKYSTPDLYCSLNFGPPLASGFRISCYYGAPDGIDGSHHNGTDFAAPGGTPIYAVADGVVSAARSMRSYGNCVQISHGTADDGNNYATLYAHMSSISVAEGQSVSKGQTIGYVGNTGDVVGRNGGYHLHLELRINGSRTDALSYIPY